MAAQRKHPHWNIKGGPGYIRGQGPGPIQRAFMRFGDKEIALGVPFTQEYKPYCLKILRAEQDRRRLEYAAATFGIDLPGHLRPVSNRPPAEQKPEGVRLTLEGLIEQFRMATYPSVSVHVRSHFECAIRHYVRVNYEWNILDDGHMVNVGQRIHTSLVKVHNSGEIALNTLSKYRKNIERVFEYIVAQGALKTNPAAGIPQQRRQSGNEPGRWEPNELEIILERLEQIQTSPAFADCVRLLMLSGIRIGEIMKITREQAASDYLPACSKVQAHQSAEKVRREIPVRMIPGLRECLDQLLALPPSRTRPTMLFPQTSLDNIRKDFSTACERGGITCTRRGINCCRKSAIWFLEHELGWDRQFIIDMIGHSREVDDKHYREVPKGKDLEMRIIRHMAGQTNTTTERVING
ncbi:MAG: hypothetical protein JWQ98_1071 [Chlorobi bacterium]|nr:hypothetical protein [Chlorobiota bacterium]